MGGQLTCPCCGEAEELTGTPGPDGIRVSCDRCGADWPREAAGAVCAAATHRRDPGDEQGSGQGSILPR